MANLGILYIYSIMFPIFAVLFSISAFYFTKKQVLACLTSCIFSSILWYISSLTTSRIIFIGNFDVISSPSYTHLGNPEFGYLFTGFGVLMVVYTILIILNRASNPWTENGE